jgi:hypothetical protein
VGQSNKDREVRIFYDNKVDASTIADPNISSENPQFIADELRNPFKTPNVWKTTGDSGIASEFVIINPAGSNIKACLILNHTLLAADTIRIQGHASSSWGSPSFNEVMTHSAGVMSEIFSNQTYAYWRLTWLKNVATTTYQIGRLFIGDFHETETQPDYDGLTSFRNDRSQSRSSVSGQVYTLDRWSQSPRRWSLNFGTITETQKENFETILDVVGTHKPFFFQIDPDGSGEVAEIIYGRFRSVPEFQVVGFETQLYRGTVLEIEESI